MLNKTQILEKYSSRLKKYQTTYEMSAWANQFTQHYRFKILCEVAPLFGQESFTVLDFGCGTGDFFEYLLSHGFRGKYIGVDINPEVAKFTKKRFASFKQAKILHASDLKKIKHLKPDFCFISGVFNDEIANAEINLKTTVDTLFKQTTTALAFNALSSIQVKNKDKHFAYFDASKLLSHFLKKTTPFVNLRHDYRRGNFTIYLYKEKSALQF